MRVRISLLAVAVAVVAGCGDSKKCPTESPQVSQLPANCEARANTAITYPIRLCPTCNQTLSGCEVDLSQVGTNQTIFLNPVVEVCEGAASCGGASCVPNPAGCSFTTPNAAPNTTFTVLVYDPTLPPPSTRQATLTIVSGAPTCTL